MDTGNRVVFFSFLYFQLNTAMLYRSGGLQEHPLDPTHIIFFKIAISSNWATLVYTVGSRLVLHCSHRLTLSGKNIYSCSHVAAVTSVVNQFFFSIRFVNIIFSLIKCVFKPGNRNSINLTVVLILSTVTQTEL